MTKRLDVLMAIKGMLSAALPGIEVLGLENEGTAPLQIPASGRVVIRAGDPGEPEIDLCPATYNYSHQIPVEIAGYQTSDQTLSAEQVVDAIVERISEAVEADRSVGGAVEYLDGYSPATDDLYVTGAEIARSADLVLIATYSTTQPL